MAKSNRAGKALVLSQDQLQALFVKLDYPHCAIARLCYLTASRAGEVVALPVSAISYDAISIKQTKTKATKEVNLYPELSDVVKQLVPQKGVYCFPGRSGQTHITLRAFQKQLDKTCDYLGIKGASSHSFRRSMATHLYREGVDLESIRQVTGHKSLDSLTLYIDIPRLEAQSKVAAAVGKLWNRVTPAE
ncbi:MAG: site-specific integrase [Symploca sp. SIO2G7]|nr:site-specific integrase [Symploca sp. SIO2G7]